MYYQRFNKDREIVLEEGKKKNTLRYNRGSTAFYFDTLHSLTVSQSLNTVHVFVSVEKGQGDFWTSINHAHF